MSNKEEEYNKLLEVRTSAGLGASFGVCTC